MSEETFFHRLSVGMIWVIAIAVVTRVIMFYLGG